MTSFWDEEKSASSIDKHWFAFPPNVYGTNGTWWTWVDHRKCFFFPTEDGFDTIKNQQTWSFFFFSRQGKNGGWNPETQNFWASPCFTALSHWAWLRTGWNPLKRSKTTYRSHQISRSDRHGLPLFLWLQFFGLFFFGSRAVAKGEAYGIGRGKRWIWRSEGFWPIRSG